MFNHTAPYLSPPVGLFFYCALLIFKMTFVIELGCVTVHKWRSGGCFGNWFPPTTMPGDKSLFPLSCLASPWPCCSSGRDLETGKHRLSPNQLCACTCPARCLRALLSQKPIYWEFLKPSDWWNGGCAMVTVSVVLPNAFRAKQPPCSAETCGPAVLGRVCQSSCFSLTLLL